MLFVWIEATQEVVDMPVAAAVLFARGKDDQLLGTLSRIVPTGGSCHTDRVWTSAHERSRFVPLSQTVKQITRAEA